VDGASKWKQFWAMTLPMLRPTIAVALVFRTLDALRVFDVFQIVLAQSRYSMASFTYYELIKQSRHGLLVSKQHVDLPAHLRLCSRVYPHRRSGGEVTMDKESPIRRILFWVLVVVVVIWMLFPFYWAINSSLKTEAQLQMTPATFVPRDPATGEVDPTLVNYGAVFKNADFWRGIKNSAIVAVSVTIIALAIGSFAAFAMGKLRFRGRTPTLYLVLAMTMFRRCRCWPASTP